MAQDKQPKLTLMERWDNLITRMLHIPTLPIDAIIMGGRPVKLSWEPFPGSVPKEPRLYLKQYGIITTAAWVLTKVENGKKIQDAWIYVSHKQADYADMRLRQFEGYTYLVTSRPIYQGNIRHRPYNAQQSWGAPAREKTISGMFDHACATVAGHRLLVGHRKSEPRRRNRASRQRRRRR